MITIKDETEDKIKNWNDDNIHVLTDFDKTITCSYSESSWEILSKENIFPKEYVEEAKKLYNYYRKYELDETIDQKIKSKLMSEWWNKHTNLLVTFKLKESDIEELSLNKKYMKFRSGAPYFFKKMYDRNIPVIIISAGIGNFIEKFLINNNCFYNNIYIISNFIDFKDGVAVGIKDKIIHSQNKNEVFIPENIKEVIKNRTNIILLGDSISDINMLNINDRSNALKIGFLDENVLENRKFYEKSFDVICTDNTNFDELSKKILLLKGKVM